jgi:hypothetical protein
MQDLWKNECQKEELKSVEIWKRKQSWLERYEEVYDSRNIFRKEESTLVEYNNRGSFCCLVNVWLTEYLFFDFNSRLI